LTVDNTLESALQQYINVNMSNLKCINPLWYHTV